MFSAAASLSSSCASSIWRESRHALSASTVRGRRTAPCLESRIFELGRPMQRTVKTLASFTEPPSTPPALPKAARPRVSANGVSPPRSATAIASKSPRAGAKRNEPTEAEVERE